jgi:hypothetical protein
VCDEFQDPLQALAVFLVGGLAAIAPWSLDDVGEPVTVLEQEVVLVGPGGVVRSP